MDFCRLWSGRITGTNVGNVYLSLRGENDRLTGEVRLNEPGVGIAVYEVTGTLIDNCLNISGHPSNQIDGYELGDVEATLNLKERGDLAGEWRSTIGSAGAITLFPQTDVPKTKFQELAETPSFYSSNHNFNSVFLDKTAIKEIGERLKRDFPSANVVITVVNEAAKSHFLKDFDDLKFDFEKANNVVLYAQETEANGIIRSARLDFGQSVNLATFQGSNESWVLGRLAILRREVKNMNGAPEVFFENLELI